MVPSISLRNNTSGRADSSTVLRSKLYISDKMELQCLNHEFNSLKWSLETQLQSTLIEFQIANTEKSISNPTQLHEPYCSRRNSSCDFNRDTLLTSVLSFIVSTQWHVPPALALAPIYSASSLIFLKTLWKFKMLTLISYTLQNGYKLDRPPWWGVLHAKPITPMVLV